LCITHPYLPLALAVVHCGSVDEPSGVPYSANGVSTAIDEAIGEFYGQPVEEHLEQFKQWLVKQL